METLNMAYLTLRSATASTSSEEEKPKYGVTNQANIRSGPDKDYECEYKQEIWEALLKQEEDKPRIHLQSPQLEFRGTLVQQLRVIRKKLSLGMATLHTAVAQLDLFMDGHRMRSDRLTYIAIACLSLAAKSEEKHSNAPSLKRLSAASGLKLCSKTLRQLEWAVGQYVNWRLLAPTAVTFASHLSQYVVSDLDPKSRNMEFLQRFKRDGAKHLDSYLDLTLSDVRLKVMDSVDVGCACVACARVELGLAAWPAWLADVSGREFATVGPIVRLLQRMLQTLNSCDFSDRGYGSLLATPSASPNVSSLSSSSTDNSRPSDARSVADTRDTGLVRRTTRTYTFNEDRDRFSVFDADESSSLPTVNLDEYYRLPLMSEEAIQRVNHPADYRYFMASRLRNASFETLQPSTSGAVKRGLDTTLGLDRKRYRIAPHVPQTVL